MIISHRHRFIFIHCRKTAGSSIARLLAPHLGPDDLHLGTWPEAYRAGVSPSRKARMDLLHPIAGLSFVARLARQPASLLNREHQIAALNGAQRLKYRNRLGPSPEHPTAAQIAAFAPEPWTQYFKFCFVRNPYYRAISDYRWRTKKKGVSNLHFVDFLRGIQQRDFKNPVIPRQFDNWPMYTISNKIAADFIGRFEYLEDDLRTLFMNIGLPLDTIPHEKKVSRKYDLNEWYGPEELALVSDLFQREIQHFNYRPV